MRGWKEGEGSGRLMEKGTWRGIKFLRQPHHEGYEALWDLEEEEKKDESADQSCCK